MRTENILKTMFNTLQTYGCPCLEAIVIRRPRKVYR